jgi:hypothetical protein
MKMYTQVLYSLELRGIGLPLFPILAPETTNHPKNSWQEEQPGRSSEASISLFKNGCLSRWQWLLPVILATWEAEIRRLTIQGQPGQIIRETASPE